jgi:hypothetical protein
MELACRISKNTSVLGVPALVVMEEYNCNSYRGRWSRAPTDGDGKRMTRRSGTMDDN